MSKQIPLPEWIKQHKDMLDKSQYFKIPQGETMIEIDLTQQVKQVPSNYGKDRFEYHIISEQKQYKMTVGFMLDVMITKALIQGMNPMTIIRAGEGQNTRYSIKGLK